MRNFQHKLMQKQLIEVNIRSPNKIPQIFSKQCSKIPLMIIEQAPFVISICNGPEIIHRKFQNVGDFQNTKLLWTHVKKFRSPREGRVSQESLFKSDERRATRFCPPHSGRSQQGPPVKTTCNQNFDLKFGIRVPFDI